MKVELEAKLTAQFEEKFNERVAMEVERVMQQMSGLHMPVMKKQEPTHTTSYEDGMANSAADLEDPTTVRLAVKDDHGNLEIVADGTAQPWPNDVVDSKRRRKTHYMVILDNPYSEYDHINLPLPTEDGLTKIGECHGSLVLWPVRLVLFEKEVKPPPQKKLRRQSGKSVESKRQSGKDSCDPRSRESAMIGKEVEDRETIAPMRCNVEDLGEECQLLYYMMSTVTNHTTTIPLPASIFHYRADTQTFVTNGDIMELLRWDRACISLIHVYMMYLFNEYISPLNLSHISFLCPERISHVENMKDKDRIEVIQYIRDAFLAKGEKDLPTKWVIAPCYERNHWFLMVIDLPRGLTYIFDSASSTDTRQFQVTGSISVAYVAHWANLEMGKKKNESQRLKFVRMKCPQQAGEVECGYYVMKLRECVTTYNDCTEKLSQVYHSKEESYSKKELDDIREEWAKFFLEKYLLPMNN